MVRDTRLDRELAFYAAHKENWLSEYEGFFVLINDEELIGVFPTFEAAYGKGIEAFGLEPFLVRQVLRHEPQRFIPAFDAIPRADS